MSAKTRLKKKVSSTAAPALPAWMDKMPRLLTFAVLVLFFLIRWGFRDIPIERDEGSYAYMGHLLLQGGVPYIDFYEMKPPGLFYSYAALSGLSGGNLGWMHVWMAVLLLAGGMFMFYLVRSWMDEGAAVVAALAYAALTMTSYASGFSIQAEHLVGFFAVAGLWSLTRGLRSQRMAFIVLAGVLLCYGLLIKQNGLFFALFSIVLVIAYHFSENPSQWLRPTLRNGLWLAAGAALPVALFGVVMLVQGNLGEFWFWNVEYPKSYTSTISWELGRTLLETGIKRMYGELPLLWMLGGAGLLLIWISRISLWKKIAVTGFLLMAAVSVTPGKRFYGHYFLHFFPALAVSAGAAVFVLGEWLGKFMGSTVRTLFGPVAALVLLILILSSNSTYYFSPNFTQILRQTYGTNPFPETRKLADYLSTRYEKGDGLIVFGSEPQIYAYTLAEAPTRHHFMGFLLKNHPREGEWQKEVVSAVTDNPPKYAVWVQHPLSWVPAQGADQMIYTWGWQFITRNYTPIAWYDQVDRRSFEVVEGERAPGYQARGENYVILLQRNTANE
jgi:hypothetical protein